ncbi:MAG: CHAT domain-containing protein [Leptolyngbya sp. LCM1.Bin17]|nr:MAG: CHAT domain-containing protein [Leptolyngbya sp. LCM1.Bin17]
MPNLLRFGLCRVWGVFFLISLTLTVWLHPGLAGSGRGHAGGIAQATTPAQLVQQGVALYQAGDFQPAIDRWQVALQGYADATDVAAQAVVNENLARAYQQLGQPAAALDAWVAAANHYRRLGDVTQLGRTLTEQAQVHLRLGQYRRAIALLCHPQLDETDQPCVAGSALALAQTHQDRLGEVAALGSLGESYRLWGDYTTAETMLQQGLALAQTDGYVQFQVPILNSLGSLAQRQARISFQRAESAQQLGLSGFARDFFAQAQQRQAEAQQVLESSLALAQGQPDPLGELQTRLNLLPIYRRQTDDRALQENRQRLAALLTQLPASRPVAYGAIALGKSYQPVDVGFRCVGTDWTAQAQPWLEQGAAIAATIADRRTESFALGELGHLYECQGAFPQAMSLTTRAQLAATDGLGAADSLYLWQWQAGRIYRQQRQWPQAMGAYEQAVATLESIRTEILVADQDLQFDFRDTVEPIYRELIDLQLSTVAPASPVAVAPGLKQATLPPPTDPTRLLEAALVTADALRLAELQNYFGNDCILTPVAQARVDLLAQSTNTAVISSVVLPDRTALIANIPNQPPQLIWIDPSQRLQEQVIQFRLGLEAYFTEPYDTAIAQHLYQQLIAPLEPTLQAADINTLVFIHDGFLRSVPMAALYDGQRFLIEKYAIATTPALTLTAPDALRPDNLQALVLGSSQAVVAAGRRFRPLPGVPREVDSVLATLPGSQALLDQEFSQAQLQQALQANPYDILHFATHGQFSPDPQENFIITGQGETVTFGQLEAFIRTSSPSHPRVDLVMLTACDTAAGDDRSTLGLAGVAIRAGARSAIASLWQADDLTTAQLTRDFYQYLQDSHLNKAQALQQAQIQAIQRGASVTPGKWAPFVLVGNWL